LVLPSGKFRPPGALGSQPRGRASSARGATPGRPLGGGGCPREADSCIINLRPEQTGV